MRAGQARTRKAPPPFSSWSKAPDGGGGGLASTGSAARWEAARLGSLEGEGGLTSGVGGPRCEGSCRIPEASGFWVCGLDASSQVTCGSSRIGGKEGGFAEACWAGWFGGRGASRPALAGPGVRAAAGGFDSKVLGVRVQVDSR